MRHPFRTFPRSRTEPVHPTAPSQARLAAEAAFAPIQTRPTDQGPVIVVKKHRSFLPSDVLSGNLPPPNPSPASDAPVPRAASAALASVPDGSATAAAPSQPRAPRVVLVKTTPVPAPPSGDLGADASAIRSSGVAAQAGQSLSKKPAPRRRLRHPERQPHLIQHVVLTQPLAPQEVISDFSAQFHRALELQTFGSSTTLEAVRRVQETVQSIESLRDFSLHDPGVSAQVHEMSARIGVLQADLRAFRHVALDPLNPSPSQSKRVRKAS